MPVSKKRKKDGKSVHMKGTELPHAEEHHSAPEAKPAVPQLRGGKPSNPFVANQQSKRGAQRGR
jgi:hypothetical protein